MFSLSRYRLALASIALALLTACNGGSSDPASIAADFSVRGVKGSISGQNVTLDLSSLGNCAVDIKAMVVTINASGYTISPDPTAARDYSKPVEFTLAAPDGTKVIYTVTVKGATCSSTSTPAPTLTPLPTSTCTQPGYYPTTGYSLIFKGCSAANVAEYYDKTECVRQNSTGLIWQGQTAAGTGLRANDQYKTNFDSTTELQKSDNGYPTAIFSAPTAAEVNASTNSIGFKNDVNATNLCGSSAWRLPTLGELLGIVRKDLAAPKIDPDWFPNTPERGIYWASTPYPKYTPFGWSVYFSGGNGSYEARVQSNRYLVRLVR